MIEKIINDHEKLKDSNRNQNLPETMTEKDRIISILSKVIERTNNPSFGKESMFMLAYGMLMSKSINFVDLAGAELLAAEARRRRALGGRLYLYSPRQPAEDMLRRGGYLDEIGEDAVFRTKAGAIAGVVAGLDRAVCARCTARVFTECRALPGPGDGNSPAARASPREAGVPGNPTRGAG